MKRFHLGVPEVGGLLAGLAIGALAMVGVAQDGLRLVPMLIVAAAVAFGSAMGIFVAWLLTHEVLKLRSPPKR